MQRYHAAGSTNAVNNSAISGASARDASRVDSSSLSSNISINSRRLSPLTSYKLKCEKEPLNSRLGPPDFHPQTTNCPEETLTREYVQAGYRETIEGLEETREISLTQVQTFNKPAVIKCKESIRKCLRAINESRAQKRKAGQVYGVPLSGSLLNKSGVFPEQRACGEDSKKKWIEGLSQPHKRLRHLADHVPHGYRRKALFEVLVRNNVPLLRATWFIKVTYLNQVRPNSSTIASGTQDRNQLSRTELWTKDVVEYLQNLLDEFCSRTSGHYVPHNRDRSQMLYVGSMQHKNDPSLVSFDGDEPSLNSKWWYVVRLLHWQHCEGLLIPSLIIDWLLGQLQEKDMLEILQLFLPIIYGFLEAIVLSQTYVRTLATIAVRFIRERSPGGSDLVDNSRRAYTTSALVEMLRYLILAVPDTFVALDCFPLPPSVLSYAASDGTFVSKSLDDARRVKDCSAEVGCLFKTRGIDSQYQTLSFSQVVSSIQKRSDNLARAASPGYPFHNMAKAVQALDKALSHGDVRAAYSFLFEQYCDGAINEGWIEEVSPSLRSSLKWLQNVSSSFVCSVFFVCEWATSEYRDFRTGRPSDVKFTGKHDIAQVYIACRLLKLKIRDLQGGPRMKSGRYTGGNDFPKGPNQHNGGNNGPAGNGCEFKSSSRMNAKSSSSSGFFESPGPLHDVIVCWIDQHEAVRGKGLMRLQLLMVELMRAGIFYPHAYVRQLIISGIMDSTLSTGNHDRMKRHYWALKQLPGSFIRDVLEEAKVAEGSRLLEAMHVYSNERRLLLQGILCGEYQNSVKSSKAGQEQKHNILLSMDGASPDHWKANKASSSNLTSKKVKAEAKVEALKVSISLLLQFPNHSTSSDSGVDESIVSGRRSIESVSSKLDMVEVTPGCEECKKAKRQKLSEDTSSALQGHSPISDDEDTWWVRKGIKTIDPSKVDPPIKPSKQGPKSRQKVVRKTQSLAQLAAARIEGSQGASTSHVCDNKVSCPHHRTANDGENLKIVDGTRSAQGVDSISVGQALKHLRFVEKRMIIVWLTTMVRQLVEDTENNTSKANLYNRPFIPDDDRKSVRWKLGEDELNVILYLMDICNELVSATKFLVWLLPKVKSHPSSTIHSGRSVMMLPRNMETHACEVGEAFWLSSLRRYENMMTAVDLLPEVLTAIFQRLAALLASNVRISGSATLIYSRYLLKRYGNVPSIAEWEKSCKTTYDKRLLSELDSGRSPDGEFGFPLGVPAGVDPDDFLRQKISGNRISRVGISMRDVVQRHIDETLHYFCGKERKTFSAGATKTPGLEKLDDCYHVAHQIIMGLMECMRQTGGAAQEGDPSLVSSAVSAIVNNIGPAIVKIPDANPGNNYSSTSSTSSLSFARRVLHIHISCLRLLKEALGERQSRVFEIALATEACSALAAAFSPGKASRGQFQMSPDAHESNNISSESANGLLGRGTKGAAAVSALIIGAVIYGVTNLERLVTVFRLREGLDVIQFVRSTKTNSNGNARSIGALKVDNLLEVYVYWFRVLVGNCRTVSDGFIVELLGEPSIVALSRMQRMLPLSLVFPPAYSIFALLLWRPFILSSNLASREDIHQLYQSMTIAISDAIRHLPFRDVCLRGSQGFYDLVTSDASDADFAALLELNGLDTHVKSMAFVPLRGRLFLNSIIDCKLPNSLFTQDDSNRMSVLGGSKVPHTDNEMKLMDKLVNVLDAVQPAKFHWQWLELRLLLNEQALIEKLEAHDMSVADAIRSSSPSPEKGAASENENKFIELILTRLLVRPDAAPLFSELVHLFGRSLEDSMLLHAKWFLGGHDVLLGRKTIRQRLVNIAESKGLSTKAQFWKPWGWSSSASDPASNRGDKKFEVTSIEEGEVIDDGADAKKSGKGSVHVFDSDSFSVSHHNVTEKALIELVLPCIDQGSEESRNTFASDLIKQLNNIEQQINTVTRGTSKQAGTASFGLEGSGNKVTTRKGIRGGSPGLARRTTGAGDSALPSPAALRTSMSLRLQLLLRLLPIICTDGEPSGRNMRHILASVILRLLGSRVVYEDSELAIRFQNAQPKRDSECLVLEAASADLSGESLFDRLLLVLHGLLSSCQPRWLKSRSTSKAGNESFKDSAGFDRELVESLQSDLDRMQLPSGIRWRIQAAMPILLPSVRCCISCQPPSVPTAAVAALQPTSIAMSGYPLHRSSSSTLSRNPTGKSKQQSAAQQDNNDNIESDPWLLLEDGTGSGGGPSSSASVNTAVIGSGSDQSNLRASSWLKGAVRVRRTDLTYIGAVDDDT